MAKNKMYFYEEFADQFDEKMDRYEVDKRLRIIFEDLLDRSELDGRRVLDAGCGTGLFSRAASERGASVTSLDVGPKLLRRVADKCNSRGVVGSVLELPFRDGAFELVISTEVIEHTPDPRAAVKELGRAVGPGGTLVVTVPCRTWKWSVHVANALKLRPYQGLENWVRHSELRRWVEEEGFTVERYFGFNFMPFYFRFTHPLIDFMDRFGDSWARFMINLGVKAHKHA